MTLLDAKRYHSLAQFVRGVCLIFRIRITAYYCSFEPWGLLLINRCNPLSSQLPDFTMSLFCFGEREPKICDWKEVEEVLERSGKFAWTWCKNKGEPFRHTAIVLYFDDAPYFTINFHPEEGAKLSAAFSECKGMLRIERITENNLDSIHFYDILQTIALTKQEQKERAKLIVQGMLSVEMRNYNLFSNNCRSYVEKVVTVFQKEVDMNEVHSGDLLRSALVTLATFVIVGLSAYGAMVADGIEDPDDRIVEKNGPKSKEK